MKKFIATAALIPTIATAGVYVEYKNEANFTEFNDLPSLSDTTNHFQVGVEGKTFYIQGGKRTDGTAAEAGYKASFGNFDIKGKVEGDNVDDWNYSAETEVRYNFK